MTEQEITKMKAEIDTLSRLEMAELWRFAPSGHPYFDNRTPMAAYFWARFQSLGGFSPFISKALDEGREIENA